MRERLTRFTGRRLAVVICIRNLAKGQKNRPCHITQLRIGDDHLINRLGIGLNFLPDTECLQHPAGRSGNCGGPLVALQRAFIGKLGHQYPHPRRLFGNRNRHTKPDIPAARDNDIIRPRAGLFCHASGLFGILAIHDVHATTSVRPSRSRPQIQIVAYPRQA